MPRNPRKKETLSELHSEDGIDLDSLIKEKHRKRWKKVLNEIYDFSPHEYGLSKSGVTDEHDLAKKLKIPGQELMLSLMFLKDHGLIEYKDHNWIILTERGFSVALENEKFRNNATIQGMSVFVALLLVLTASFSFVNSTDLVDPLPLLIVYSISLVIIYFAARRTFSWK
jgi:hypothetical protein